MAPAKQCASQAGAKGAVKKSNASSCPPLLARDVVAAVESLYADELQPTSRILHKRLSERVACATHRIRDLQQLRAICEANPLLMVAEEGGSDWSACLVGRKLNFKDVHDPVDSYPEELWTHLKAYIERCPCDSAAVRLPGGRYESAKALRQQCPAFLAGRSLGEVCHIVQLALTQRKILGYSNGCMVPYQHSQSQAKEKCASLQRPCSGSGGNVASMPLATWDVARSCLQEILESAPSHEVPLPNVKRFFCSRFNIQLSETMLGYSKVSDLLQDEHFHDICTIKLRGSSYVVVLVEKEERSIISLSEHLFPCHDSCNPANADSEQLLQSNSCMDHDMPLTLEDADFTPQGAALACPDITLDQGTSTNEEDLGPSFQSEMARLAGEHYAGIVKNTFIHASTCLVRDSRRNLTVPKGMALSRGIVVDRELEDDPEDSSSESTVAQSSDLVKPVPLSGSSSDESFPGLHDIAQSEHHQKPEQGIGDEVKPSPKATLPFEKPVSCTDSLASDGQAQAGAGDSVGHDPSGNQLRRVTFSCP